MASDEEESELFSFRVLEVASGKKKETPFPWHILEVCEAMTFAKVFEALLAIDHPAGTVALSEYANSTPQCYVSQTDGDGTRHKASLGTRIVRCCPRFGRFVTFEVVSPKETSAKLDAFSMMMNAGARQTAPPPG